MVELFQSELTIENLAIIEDVHYGDVYLNISPAQFLGLGFAYGDSVDIELSNGLCYEDLPFYDGYYGRLGDVLLCGYKKYSYIALALCQGSMWLKYAFDESVTARVSLRSKGKYLRTQELMGREYSWNPADYDCSFCFANFRVLKGGYIKPGTFYRGASPCNNRHGRAKFVDEIISNIGIKYILDLADNESEVARYFASSDYDSPYFLKLCQDKQVAFPDLQNEFASAKYKDDLGRALKELIKHEGPFYIHCIEGKDRTGFVCALLEAFMGASLKEIEADYMLTYMDYFGVTKESEPETYALLYELKFLDIALCIAGVHNEKQLANAKLMLSARRYLMECGLTFDEWSKLWYLLSGGIKTHTYSD
ncbi:MAG: tyrosine-protein phosphatase [Phascolarctobacterium sp.]|nr:tyrosine-protein phosphatase [Phascolarctobacterium sp.]